MDYTDPALIRHDLRSRTEPPLMGHSARCYQRLPSKVENSMDDEEIEHETSVVQAFCEQNYQLCVERAESRSRGTVLILQLFATSLIRLHGERALPTLRERIEKLRPFEWPHRVTSFLIGDEVAEAVLGLIRDDDRLAEFHLICGTKLLTEGRVDSARNEFRACLDVQDDGVPSLLAKVQMNWLAQTPLPESLRERIEESQLQAKQAFQQDQFQDALDLAAQALRALDRHDGAIAVDRVQILNTLIVVSMHLDRKEEMARLAKESLDYLDGLGPGEAAHKVLALTDDIIAIFTQKGEWELVQRALMRNIGLRLHYKWGEPSAAVANVVKLARACCELLQRLAAARHLDGAIKMARDLLADDDGRIEFLRSAIPISRWLKSDNPPLGGLAGIIDSLSVGGDGSEFDEPRFIVMTAALHVWPHSEPATREILVTCLHRCIRCAPDPTGDETRKRAIEIFRGMAHALPDERVPIETITDAFSCLARLIQLPDPDGPFWRELLIAEGSPEPLSEDLVARITTAFAVAHPQDKSELVADMLLDFADRRRQSGAYATALQILSAMATRIDSGLTLARVNCAKGYSLYDLSNNASAVRVLEDALAILEAERIDDPELEWKIASGLGVANQTLEKRCDWHKRAYDAARRVVRNPTAAVKALYNLAHSRIRLGEHAEVIKEVTDLLHAPGPATADPLSTALLRLAGADAALAAERYDLSRSFLEEIPADLAEEQDEKVGSNFHLLRAHTFAGLKDWSKALDSAIKLMRFHEKHAAKILRFSSDSDRRVFFDDAKGFHDVLLSILCEGVGFSAEEIARAWSSIQCRDSMEAEAMLAEQTLNVADAALKAASDELKTVQSAITAIRLTGSVALRKEPDLKKRSEFAFNQLKSLRARRAELQRYVRQSSEYGVALQRLEAERVSEQRLLARDSFRLCHVVVFDALPAERRYPDRSSRRTRIAVFVKGTLNDSVSVFVSAPLDLELFRSLDEPSDDDVRDAELERRALDRVENEAAALLRRAIEVGDEQKEGLVLVLDSVLQKVCIPAFVDSNGRALLDRFDISFSTRLAGSFLQPVPGLTAGRTDHVIVIGAPTFSIHRHFDSASRAHVRPEQGHDEVALLHYFDVEHVDRSRIEFSPLPGAQIEAALVGEAIGVEPICGALACTSRKAQFPQCRIIHLATHGFFIASPSDHPQLSRLLAAEQVLFYADPESIADGPLSILQDNPLHRSGLAMAGANDFLRSSDASTEYGTGLLLAADIMNLDLSAAELIFLSACETGRGATQIGESVAGLQRSFLAAGAQALIVSIWSIPDILTCILVREFYRVLFDGCTVASALCEAQRYIRDLPQSVYNEQLIDLQERFAVDLRRSLLPSDAPSRPFMHPQWWGGFRCVGDTNRTIRQPIAQLVGVTSV